VPTSFVEKCNISSKEIKEGEQNTKVENEHMLTNIVSTFEILERIENSVGPFLTFAALYHVCILSIITLLCASYLIQ
jgi:hypothetical protein